MKANFVNSAVKDLRKLESRLTRDIRIAATKAGWDKQIVSSLVVKVKSDEVVVSYPDKYVDAIDDLEYGTKLTSPRPVFRTFMRKNQETLTSSVEDMLMKTLVETVDSE